MFPTSGQVDSIQKTLGDDALAFLPELVLCVGIVSLLLARLVPLLDRVHLGGLALASVAISLFAAAAQIDGGQWSGPFFGRMLSSDAFGGLVRCLILAAALLTVLLSQLTRIPDTLDSADFHTLLLGGTLGMLLMASANHLLMIFIAVEMASLPGYALAGFLKGKKAGSEAALKYVVYGAGASGIMLYGISLIAGIFGTGFLPDIAAGLVHRGLDLPVMAGFSLILVGLGFKLAAVPFHFWCPDVFEGAAAEVAGFLSVASKAAAVALTLRVLLTVHERMVAAKTGVWVVPESLGLMVGVIGAVTVTFGNLAAFGQTNLKRLLAYSTIAHAGYMLLAVATVTAAGTGGVLFYLAAYILMNLGAFAVVALVRNATGREDLEAYRGLVQRSPVLAITFTIFLLSLLGLPPLAGFAGKFQVFAAVFEAARSATAAGHGQLGNVLFGLLAVGAVNTALSAYYYLKIARAMLLDEPTDATPISTTMMSTGYLYLLVAGLFVLGVWWNPLLQLTGTATSTFLK